MAKESSYQKMKRKLAEKEEAIQQLRSDLRSIILKEGDHMRRVNVIQRVRLEKDAEDLVWYGDGTRSGRRTTGGIFEVMQRKLEPVNPDLKSNIQLDHRHPNHLQEQFEKTVFGTDWSSKDMRDESAFVGWTPDGPMTLSQMQEWIERNRKRGDKDYPIKLKKDAGE